MPAHRQAEKQQQATYLSLLGTFLTVLSLFGIREQRRQGQPPLTPFDFVLV